MLGFLTGWVHKPTATWNCWWLQVVFKGFFWSKHRLPKQLATNIQHPATMVVATVAVIFPAATCLSFWHLN